MRWPFVLRRTHEDLAGIATAMSEKCRAQLEEFSKIQAQYTSALWEHGEENSRLKEELVDQNCSPLRDERISLRRRLDTEYENVKVLGSTLKARTEERDAATQTGVDMEGSWHEVNHALEAMTEERDEAWRTILRLRNVIDEKDEELEAEEK